MNHHKLCQNHIDKINNFLLKHLSGEGLENWDSYKSQTMFFKIIFEKKIRNPIVFWNIAEMKHPNLSKVFICHFRLEFCESQFLIIKRVK